MVFIINNFYRKINYLKKYMMMIITIIILDKN